MDWPSLMHRLHHGTASERVDAFIEASGPDVTLPPTEVPKALRGRDAVAFLEAALVRMDSHGPGGALVEVCDDLLCEVSLDREELLRMVERVARSRFGGARFPLHGIVHQLEQQVPLPEELVSDLIRLRSKVGEVHDARSLRRLDRILEAMVG